MSSSIELPKVSVAESSSSVTVDLHLVRPRDSQTAARNFRLLIFVSEVFADFVTTFLAIRLGYATYLAAGIGKHVYFRLNAVWVVSGILAAIIVLMLDRVGAYRKGNSLLRVRETEQVLRVSTEVLVSILAVSFFASIVIPRLLLIIGLGFVPLLLFIEKNLMYFLVHALHSHGYGNERVLIYGAGCTGRRVFSVLKASPRLGLVPVAVVDDDPGKVGATLFEMAYERRHSTRILQGPVTREMLAEHDVDLVIIAIPGIEREAFAATVENSLSADVPVSFVPSHVVASDSWLDYRDMDGILLASFAKPKARLGYELLKRAFDVIAALALIIVAAPFFLVMALIIKMDSAGPVFFRQKRIGRGGKSFQMYKLRSMRATSCAYEYSPRESSDPRITRIGKFLRRTSLDELPQLFNVVQGTMSLVGPRPEMPFIVEQYTPRHRQRLQVKPGLTGLWQLSGDRAFLIHENIEYDLYYIQHRNMFMDLAVLLHTLIFAMRGV